MKEEIRENKVKRFPHLMMWHIMYSVVIYIYICLFAVLARSDAALACFYSCFCFCFFCPDVVLMSSWWEQMMIIANDAHTQSKTHIWWWPIYDKLLLLSTLYVIQAALFLFLFNKILLFSILLKDSCDGIDLWNRSIR
jgi:hypothetical protein